MDMPPLTSVFEHQPVPTVGHEEDHHDHEAIETGTSEPETPADHNHVETGHGGHEHGDHDHSSWDSIWQEYLQLLGDPAHIMFEITATLVFDLVFIGLIYGVLIRKFLIPKLRRDFHKEFDKEHGIDHAGHDHSSDTVDDATQEQEPK